MRRPAGKGSAVFFIIFHESTLAMCNSELYLTVVRRGGGVVWLGRVERRLDSRRGGAWRGMVAPLFVCQPRWDLSTPSALVHARANVCRYIYVYIYIYRLCMRYTLQTLPPCTPWRRRRRRRVRGRYEANTYEGIL